MTSQQFLAQVSERSGVADARGPVRAVLQSLAECLSRRQAEALADELPDEPAALLRNGNHNQDLDRFDLESRVAQRAGLSRGAAVEWLFAVGRTLGESVRDEVLVPLRRDLPADVAGLLEAAGPLPAPEGVHHDVSKRTLAEGASGHSHPLYAARPDTAQTESVARAANPHGDTKLSSATGLTQEREEESLATARGLTQERDAHSLSTSRK
jgi:uncharacterized protein (DUF2267 family)